MAEFQSLIVNLLDLDKKQTDQKISKIREILKEDLDDTGTIWILSNSSYKNDIFFYQPFHIAESFDDLLLKNIILVPKFDTKLNNKFFTKCTFEILFFAKSKNYFFDKDPIREEHIWKNVEWGQRKKNYHPLGKDPGNVWIKTKDDGKGKITNHIQINFEEALNRIVKISSKESDKVKLINIKTKIDRKNIFYEFL